MADSQSGDATLTSTSSSEALDPRLPPSPCDCDTDPVAGLKRLFVDYFQGRGMAMGRDPATRPVFLRLHGVAHGTFEVRPDLPPELRVGLFGQPASYATWVRFSSDVQPGLPDLKGTIGVSLKLFGVGGTKVISQDSDASTHDFVLQNHDVFFVDNAAEMCRFTCDSLHGTGDDYLKHHPVTAQVLADMAKTVPSVLESAYWSVLPFKFGGRHAKYKLVPVDGPGAESLAGYGDPFYLRADLVARLRKGPAQLHFMVQLQTSEQDMPLDRATVRWSEEVSPPIHVATLTLPAQDLEARGQSAYGEALSFNTWRTLPEHMPVGTLAEARRIVYQASADNRRNVNGQTLGEPRLARPAEYEPGIAYPSARDTRIVRASIHPAIGVARLGNSSSQFFIGPQVVEPPPAAPGFYRDAQCALKRQAAEFRIYGYNAAGDVVQELTADSADIMWSVHLANKKAAWYQWQMAMDIPEAQSLSVPLRNPNVSPADRSGLVIDAGPVSVSGKGAQAKCQGAFIGGPVLLGELRIDDAGRLRVLGGHGVSASPTNSDIYTDPASFGNADGWHDDIADGPVTAEVNIGGREIPVEAAWVVSAPPNYAPQIKGVRTLYDLLYDLFVQSGWLPPKGTVSFSSDVLPLLKRLTGLQWVNAGFASQFGAGGAFNFEDPAFQMKLATTVAPGEFDTYYEVRRQIFNSFRPPDVKDSNQLQWPWLYGDAMDVPAGTSPRQNAAITFTQWQALRRWSLGDFENDLATAGKQPQSINEVKLSDQPSTLDRAALEFCLADAFHPGCEVTWPLRHLTLFSRPYRIRHRSAESPPEKDYGKQLTQTEVLAADGPLFDQGPGDLTRWMCVPWQADTAWCRSAYDTKYDPFVPTFWPARVPNQVLTNADYAVVIDPSATPQHRLNAFIHRSDWNLPLGKDTAPAMSRMVKLFGDMGILEVRPGPADGQPFATQMLVASFGPGVPEPPPIQMAQVHQVPAFHAAKGAKTAKMVAGARGANFASEEEARRAPRPVRHPEKK